MWGGPWNLGMSSDRGAVRMGPWKTVEAAEGNRAS